MPLIVGVLGILLAYITYIAKPGLPAVIASSLRPVHQLFFNKWYFDQIYEALFVKSAVRLGRVFWNVGDKEFIDGLGPDGFAYLSRKTGSAFSRFQSGFVYQYAFVMMIALVAMVSWLVFRVQPAQGIKPVDSPAAVTAPLLEETQP
jgi:NADH-quinone oxidoreductase subunit L